MSQFPINCPVSNLVDDVVTLAHGEGGRWTRRLIRQRILTRLGNIHLEELSDAATLPKMNGAPVMTTDSYVVSPLFFPGGDIGTLAVYGTVNDLVVSGALPKWIALSMIIEEGFPLLSLDRVLTSIAAAARIAQVQIVTGDTKVVPRGATDGIYLTTTGVGELIEPAPSGPRTLEEGDVILVTGPIGQHGISILAARENLGFDPMPQSDCGSLWNAAEALRNAGCEVRSMRDATRGGISAVLHEWADSSNTTIAIDEHAVPVSSEVRGACELLGLDPLHLANEGTMVVAVPGKIARCALPALQEGGRCPMAAIIGEVTARRLAPVVVRRGQFAEIPLEEPQGAPFPRIC
ncbi:hydrogenase expression/formation protein HypE [Blastopirellula marina]|uniref:Hydrogenase expression/formation protein HypE n=1 Tax=Blastopirellula marina TaxID=124 RepID=A0A2S8F139_9BACT|nr:MULTISPECIES: hydrogenase expression/formation protein HypE [Pirellulaceae]PQO25644.1 hydrogenase expression/formation protein HypE [Blastopirellula marina]RCS43327.1 hydrogenase expression/formation protein HypE [Bremerella cremea]